MSKKYKSTDSRTVQSILKDYDSMTLGEFEDIYGIEFNSDTVYDAVYNRTFNSVAEWAQFSVEQDDFEYTPHVTKNTYHPGIDDYY